MITIILIMIIIMKIIMIIIMIIIMAIIMIIIGHRLSRAGARGAAVSTGIFPSGIFRGLVLAGGSRTLRNSTP